MKKTNENNEFNSSAYAELNLEQLEAVAGGVTYNEYLGNIFDESKHTEMFLRACSIIKDDPKISREALTEKMISVYVFEGAGDIMPELKAKMSKFVDEVCDSYLVKGFIDSLT